MPGAKDTLYIVGIRPSTHKGAAPKVRSRDLEGPSEQQPFTLFFRAEGPVSDELAQLPDAVRAICTRAKTPHSRG